MKRKTVERFHKAMNLLVRARKRSEVKVFMMTTCDAVEWKYVPVLLRHLCDIPDGMHMSGAQHGPAVKGPRA